MNKVRDLIEERLTALDNRIDKALSASLRNRSRFTMVAVTKRQPLSVIKAAYELGLRHFGESQIQEAVPKVKACSDDITWHFIGHLQKNKVRKAVQMFTYIHSIDSLSLLQRVNLLAGEERVCPKLFLQVNYALDPDKHGLHPDAVEPVMEALPTMKHVECVGLMGIPPLSAGSDEIEAFFQGITNLRDATKKQFPEWQGLLSLGMSNDFEAAIAAGANMIRVGTTLFGERQSCKF